MTRELQGRLALAAGIATTAVGAALLEPVAMLLGVAVSLFGTARLHWFPPRRSLSPEQQVRVDRVARVVNYGFPVAVIALILLSRSERVLIAALAALLAIQIAYYLWFAFQGVRWRGR